MPLANRGQTAQKLAIWFPGRMKLDLNCIYTAPLALEGRGLDACDTIYFTDSRYIPSNDEA